MENRTLPAALAALLAVSAPGCVGTSKDEDTPHSGTTVQPCLTPISETGVGPCLQPIYQHTAEGPHSGEGPHSVEGPHTGEGSGGTGASGHTASPAHTGGTGAAAFDADDVLGRLPEDVARRLRTP